MKTDIIYVRKKIKGGFIGMNPRAAQSHKLPFENGHKHPEHDIEVFKGGSHLIHVHTIRHEEFEDWEMRRLEKKGYSKDKAYHCAHNLALQFEKKNMPFPKRNILVRLKKKGVRFK
jgi:hypothetical protein